MNKSKFFVQRANAKNIRNSFFFCRYAHPYSSSRTEKILEDMSNKLILIHYADHIQDLISFQDTNWNINRIISIQIVIFIFVDDISYQFRMVRSSIIVYLSFQMIIIWFISLLYFRDEILEIKHPLIREIIMTHDRYIELGYHYFNFFFQVIFLLF